MISNEPTKSQWRSAEAWSNRHPERVTMKEAYALGMIEGERVATARIVQDIEDGGAVVEWTHQIHDLCHALVARYRDGKHMPKEDPDE